MEALLEKRRFLMNSVGDGVLVFPKHLWCVYDTHQTSAKLSTRIFPVLSVFT